MGRLWLTRTRALLVCLFGLMLCLIVGPTRASAAKESPTPNPAPNHTLSPAALRHSPIPAPAPPDAEALGVPSQHDRAAPAPRAAGNVHTVTRTPSAHAAPSENPRFAQSLTYSGLGALAVAGFGLLAVGMRRRLW